MACDFMLPDKDDNIILTSVMFDMHIHYRKVGGSDQDQLKSDYSPVWRCPCLIVGYGFLFLYIWH